MEDINNVSTIELNTSGTTSIKSYLNKSNKKTNERTEIKKVSLLTNRLYIFFISVRITLRLFLYKRLFCLFFYLYLVD